MKPRIQIISRPNIDWKAIDTFLNEEKTDWKRTEKAKEAEEL